MLIPGLYTLQELVHTDTSITADISLDASHDIFKGHFPGNPIMPGVCMMQIIKELTEKVLEKPLVFKHASNVKFMAKINPETHPDLKIEISYKEEEGILKLKNASYFEDTLALKLSATYAIAS